MILALTAFLDANVLYGARPRSLFITLGRYRLLRPRFSDLVHEEWTRSLKSRRPDIEPEKINRLRALINEAVADGIVAGFEPLIGQLNLPDPEDRHVLAAAIHCKACVIVTFNLADFPPDAIEPYGIRAVHPDNFLLELYGLDEDRFTQAVREDIAHYRNPTISPEDYAASLAKAGLPKAARIISGLV